MATNDQVLSIVGGQRTTASGRVDGSEGPERTGTPSTDDAAIASSQSGDGDVADNAVDSGAAGSAPAPADPSVPPIGACPLIDLPPEMLGLITAGLDPIAHHGIRLARKCLRERLNAAPLMSYGEYVQFQRQLEVHSNHKVRNLFCSFCDTFKRPTPSKTTFTDAQAVQNYGGRRLCVECGIANGHYDKRDVVIKKRKFFVCGGCKLILTHDKEDTVVADVVVTKGYPYRDSGWGRGAEITFGDGGKRWCKGCRAAIAGLGNSGAMKLKQVYMP